MEKTDTERVRRLAAPPDEGEASDNALLAAALAYTHLGWAVFPCRPGRKAPMTDRGFYNATTDAATIRAWWRKWPRANIGVAAGASGLVVIDADAKDGAPGLESWRDLVAELGPGIGDTVTAETPTGGLHMIYNANGHYVRNSAGKLAPGLDVRGEGGYFLGAPSAHPDGGRYEWAMGYSPDDMAPIPLPATLAKLLTETERKVAGAVGETIPKGQRNDTLASLAGTMRRRGMSESEIAAGLLAVNAERCEPPLPEGEVLGIARSIAGYAPAGRQRAVGEGLPKEAARLAVKTAPPPPDAALRQTIINTLLGTGLGKDKDPLLLRRLRAGEMLLTWLRERGGFVRTVGGDLYWFSSEGRRLRNLEGNEWAAFLYALAGTNPAGADYKHLLADCVAAAIGAEMRQVVRVAAWDGAVLRVSGFDGSVYALDGSTVRTEPNGAAALFADDPTWTPYDLGAGDGEALRWLTETLPNWAGPTDAGHKPAEVYGLALRAFILSTFFSELCPTRPLAVLLGERGAGKTLVWRVLLRLLFGPFAEVAGTPDKADAFVAAAAASHLLVLDNLDTFTPWLRDKLARASTGGVDHYRRLYTSNEAGTVRYRVWLGFTARSPDTLRRDDLADRLLILPVDRIPEGRLRAERSFLDQALATRGAFWGDLLAALNKVVAHIRREGLPDASTLRLADWESFGRVVARVEGREPLWDAFVATLKRAQGDFLLEDDLLAEGLGRWLEVEAFRGREVTARELHEELGELLFGGRKRPSDWPGSTMGFAKRLAGLRRDLRHLYRVEWGKSTRRETRGTTAYRFWPLGEE